MIRPRRIWRVEFSEGFGYPEPYKRELSKRTYETAADAAQMVRSIAAHPTHHDLVGVWTTPCDWEPVDPAGLPTPDDQEGHE